MTNFNTHVERMYESKEEVSIEDKNEENQESSKQECDEVKKDEDRNTSLDVHEWLPWVLS